MDGYKVTHWGFGPHEYEWAYDDSDRRTPQSHPYSYDAHFIKGDRESTRGCETVYDDRMRQWNFEKYREAQRAVFGDANRGDYFMRNASADHMGRFMSHYYNRPIRVYGMAEGCNQSNGYPYWIVYFKERNTDV